MNLLATVQSINNPILQALAAGLFTWTLTRVELF